MVPATPVLLKSRHTNLTLKYAGHTGVVTRIDDNKVNRPPYGPLSNPGLTHV